jgi:hypothetical protein
MILASSGPFSYGLAYADAAVEGGAYTLLVSSWEREAVGAYTLVCESSAPLTLAPIPQEGAGMYARTVHGRWDARTAGGRPSGSKYALNPAVELVLPAPTAVMARLYLPQPAPVPVNITLFRRAASGNGIGEQVATSGPYVEATSGVALPRTRLPPGVYLLIPSTYERGMLGEWVLDVWGDKAFSAEVRK